jgi:hypothetical protein
MEAGPPRVWCQRGVGNGIRCLYNWLVSTSVFNSEDWRFAGKAAAFLGVDRDLCRRALHWEPACCVRALARRVLFGCNLPAYNPEQVIEEWARERRAGVYGAGRRSGDLERARGIAVRAMLGHDALA